MAAIDTARHARIKEVFLAVVDLPPAERPAALERACASDSGLRAEVESLLVHHRDDSLLDTPRPAPVVEELPAGQKVGSFRVVRKLGQGGMGTVYEAMHQYIERRAAIKVLHLHLSQDEQHNSRFLNEARAVNLIQHPGLVEVFEFGLLDSGTAFTVMEFLEGEPLTARLRRATAAGGGLADESLEIALQIAQAMAAVHEKQIVHRDLKPDNVMVLPDVERPFGLRVKVLDFGAAKLSPSLDGRVRTETGAIIGTPAYMSPEQCAGEAALDGKSDVYALGIVLYQMLTGALPFDAKLSFDHLAAHMHKTPRPLREHMPSVPEALSTLLGAMLHKAPAERPTMLDVAARLEQLLAAPSLAFSLSVRPVSADGEAQPVSRDARRSPLFFLAPLLLFALGGALLLALLPHGKPRPASSVLRSEPDAPPPSPQTVHWEVRSTPPGADVVSADDKLLGSTPWSVERPLQPGETRLTLRRPGFVDARLVLSNQQSTDRRVELSPVPPPAAPPATKQAPEPPHAPPPKPRAKRNKSGDVEVKLMMD